VDWALKVHQKLANPASFVSLGAALSVVLLHPETYMKAHWFHGKLTLVIAVFGLHHVLAAKIKKLEPGATVAPTLGWMLGGVSTVVVVLAVFQQVLIP
jgi:uncharacterized membrane protein